MKDYFLIRNHKKAMENQMKYGCSYMKRIKRKWFNPLKYLMGEYTNKTVKNSNFYENNQPKS